MTSQKLSRIVLAGAALGVMLTACAEQKPQPKEQSAPVAAPEKPVITPDFILDDTQTHARFSALIEPVLTVPPGSVIEAFTHEATGGQIDLSSDVSALGALDFDKIHTLTGPVLWKGPSQGMFWPLNSWRLRPPIGAGWRFYQGLGCCRRNSP